MKVGLAKCTIIYYTSNREDPEFERKVQESLLENCGGLPIISVSQKPINLGKNICVGVVDASGFNMFRQIQIGLKEIKTKFVISAEADCLYPPDYFTFVPEKEDVCYRNNNTYIVPQHRDFFFKKHEGGTWSQIIGREFYMKRLEELFKGLPEWSDERNFPKERTGKNDVFEKINYFTTENPCVSFKANGMRHYSHSDRTPILELPFWGNGKDVRKKYLWSK